MQKHVPIRVGMLITAMILLLTAIVMWQAEVVAQTEPPDTPDGVAQTEPEEESGSTSTADHAQFEELQRPFATGPEVTVACLECHTEAAKQIQATTHWTWEETMSDGEVVGKRNVVNNFCVAVETNEPRCTSCHTGYGWKDDTFDFSAEQNVDCLVCHDTTGQYRKFPAGAGHPTYETREFPPNSGKIWEPPDLNLIAQNVGDSSRSNCGACHFSGGGGDGVKHGDMDTSLKNPSFELDVHMSPDGQNFDCTACHNTDGHNVPGSRYEMTTTSDGQAMPNSHGELNTCESCHGDAPMADDKLNDHVDQIACQTCHIPEYAREKPTKMFWDWSTAGQFKEDGAPIVEKDENGWVIYDTKKGDFVWAMNVVPEYVWFNGETDYMTAGETIDDTAVVPINQLFGTPDDPDARIWPVKRFAGVQPYDPINQMLAIPHLFGKDENAYWKSYDWNLAIAAGMDASELPYSGTYDFVESEMYWPITHMVAPAENALGCEDCHSDNSRLAGVEGIYIPGLTGTPLADFLGRSMVVLALVGVVLHGGARIVTNRKEDKEDQS